MDQQSECHVAVPRAPPLLSCFDLRPKQGLVVIFVALIESSLSYERGIHRRLKSILLTALSANCPFSLFFLVYLL
jgi:hypothetical protein